MVYGEYLDNVKKMIDDLKAMTADLGLGNAPEEYNIITVLFTYKFLNDKLLHSFENREDKSETFEDFVDYADSKTAKIKEEYLLNNLFQKQNEKNFHKTFDNALKSISDLNKDVYSIETSTGVKKPLMEPMSVYLRDVDKEKELAKRAKQVVSVELDSRLLPVLDETLAEFDNIEIVNADIMKLDLRQLIEEKFGGLRVVVCANLPYYITSPVITMLLESKLPIESITVMIQKEVADRLTCPVGSRDSGAVTACVHYYAKPEKLFDVKKGSFMPMPKVDSAVIRLDVRKKPAVEVKDEEQFFRLVKAAFAMRRKTVLNSVSAGLSLPKGTVEKALLAAGLDCNVRAEKLTLEEFAALLGAIEEVKA